MRYHRQFFMALFSGKRIPPQLSCMPLLFLLSAAAYPLAAQDEVSQSGLVPSAESTGDADNSPRVGDFYTGQARHYLSFNKPTPQLLPAFPGIDGDDFGHWGVVKNNRNNSRIDMSTVRNCRSAKSSGLNTDLI